MIICQYNKVSFFKAIFVKYLALIIGICYLANPMQQQIGSVFHELSHFFETPNNVIGHQSSADSSEAKHHYHEHIHSSDEHEHEFIDLLAMIFDNSTEDGEEESVLAKVKFDKHIKTDDYPEEKKYPATKKLNFFSSQYGIIDTYPGILKEPPQILSV